MKFTAFTFLAIMGLANALNLRATAGRLLGAEESDPANARVIIHGLMTDASDEDLKIIRKSTAAAYNSAYSATGHSIDGLKELSSFAMPDKVQWLPNCRMCHPDDDSTLADSDTQAQVVFVEWLPNCRMCHPDDDATTSLQMQAFNVADIHKNFEESFCGLLRASGSANLANAKDCSFSVLETPGQSDLVPFESAYASTNGESTEAQVVMHGTLNDFSDKDMTLIDTSIVLAYNEAFTKAGYTVDSFKSLADVDVPLGWLPNCRMCHPDDDATMVNAAKMIFARVMPNSTADDGAEVVLKDNQIAFMHQAFEKSFCTKLQNSGTANFANVHDCRFNFVYNPVGGAETAQQ